MEYWERKDFSPEEKREREIRRRIQNEREHKRRLEMFEEFDYDSREYDEDPEEEATRLFVTRNRKRR